MPEGQLQIYGIVNLHLMVLNHLGLAILIPLKKFEYIEFCIELISGYIERMSIIYKASSKNMKTLMKSTLGIYGITLPDLN